MRVDSIIKNCYGCECCENVCHQNAIKMNYNNEGFYYPSIDNTLCNMCGLCYKKCPQNLDYIRSFQEYYAFSKYSEVESCASGGIATCLSKLVLKLGGYVCGCVYDDDFNVVHIISKDENDIDKMKTSKYVQSSLNDSYIKIRDLLVDKLVLFIGTPCQVAGIKSFVGQNKNFYAIDLICHGVPSPLLFKYYINYLEKKYHSKLKSFNFRYKHKGVWGQTIRYSFNNGKSKIVPRDYDKYDLDYKKRVNYRESCYTCKFSNLLNRPGDITIGDFWGINHSDKNYDKSGVSSIIINTNKGKELLNLIDNNLYFSISKDDILLNQDALHGPSFRNKERDFYYKGLDDGFFDRKKQPKPSLKSRFSHIIPTPFKKILKKVLLKR